MTGYESKRAAAQDKLNLDDRSAYYKKYDDLYVVYLNGVYDGKKRRTWVGLTDEDCKGMSAGDKVVAMWADRILKERNA